SILSCLHDNPKGQKNMKRVGRGPSSGYGKTAGRGENGQKKKSSVHPWFEGGQTPMHRRLPKRGFHNSGEKNYVGINLSRLQEWIDSGRLDASRPITMKEMLDSRLCRGIKTGVKLLANGKEKFTTKVDITVSGASREAIKTVEAAGGKVTSKYYNRLALRALLHPEFFKIKPLEARPIKKRDLDYYRNPDVRGYLA
ncbi:ribosomal protein L18e/L15P, partial [Dipodascopsis uninucleata]